MVEAHPLTEWCEACGGECAVPWQHASGEAYEEAPGALLELDAPPSCLEGEHVPQVARRHVWCGACGVLLRLREGRAGGDA